ncbi:hypothetical protein GSI_02001 [Ganoderma sinense ZZ0214-1]|uniref:Uncharacterized protein n=1 Tax=Ganoderma sinense ZZ0214-1 TaxID=1077348 RepID=A0A2G8SND0_9APHY|nr:hypothetical protein GSI_02001 [Ganoderma sinense ZZ0214-1]
MSHETLVSQFSLSDSPKLLTSWFASKPPSGYEALPYEEDSESESDEHSEDDEASEEGSDVELWVLQSPSDIEACPATHLSPASRELITESTPKRGSGSPHTRMCGVLKMSLILLTAGLPFTLLFSALSWLVGGIVLSSIFKAPPYDTASSGAAFKASMAGAPLVALAVGALTFLDFLVRRLPSASADQSQYDPQGDAMAVAVMSAAASVLAMPLGFLMAPRLGTETFGAWHALGWSATGLGVPVGGVLLCCLPQLLWCDAVDL